ncbi:hypothetical protein J2127_001099 [Methanococcus voltae]|uniref:Uncharacterized protein n=1 Tax=Methanococcus voltae PS TaxID=523842 RepID=A0ABT2EYK2_METVO|nr:DUF2540 domain-containing protein [Methanococcus voltae]MBP2143930.1 hypothetical protein [Methanococcus voltae]MCS3922000.1 hypothetical protein [Methanococcus voltae PS]
MRKYFYTRNKIDSRDVRYFLHKIEELKEINPEYLVQAVKYEKKHKVSITLSEREAKIVEKYGKATDILINYLQEAELHEGYQY